MKIPYVIDADGEIRYLISSKLKEVNGQKFCERRWVTDTALRNFAYYHSMGNAEFALKMLVDLSK